MDKALFKVTGFLDTDIFLKANETKTKFLSSNPKELCNRLEFSVQKKRAGNCSDIFIEEIVPLTDKLLKCRCIFTRHHSFSNKNCCLKQLKNMK